mmetsp:Transcript_15286/g.59744  ORF Transcript_15286/g.59744 Transcript_15286/m.59744 type:complete len:279 (-) Transcript_15286:829-1665(-)
MLTPCLWCSALVARRYLLLSCLLAVAVARGRCCLLAVARRHLLLLCCLLAVAGGRSCLLAVARGLLLLLLGIAGGRLHGGGCVACRAEACLLGVLWILLLSLAIVRVARRRLLLLLLGAVVGVGALLLALRLHVVGRHLHRCGDEGGLLLQHGMGGLAEDRHLHARRRRLLLLADAGGLRLRTLERAPLRCSGCRNAHASGGTGRGGENGRRGSVDVAGRLCSARGTALVGRRVERSPRAPGGLEVLVDNHVVDALALEPMEASADALDEPLCVLLVV